MKIFFTICSFILSATAFAQAQGFNLPGMSLNFGQGADLVDTLQLLSVFTIITLAPAILVLCTCFTRIIVIMAFIRQAIGTQNMPPNQLLVGFSLFLTFFIMQPTAERMYQNSISPYMEKKATSIQAIRGIEYELRGFMSKQVRKTDLQLFYDITGASLPGTIDDVPTHFLIPLFIISELKTAFQIGFLLYLPFLILDMVIASVLMAMGMMMLPPVIVSFPFKLLLFVLVDGWHLVTGSVIRSFN
jgi:flagellar biosynthetic protein FliP